MANLFAGHDPTWAQLPAPAPTQAAAGHCCFFPAAFENEALTSALRASMAPAHGSAAAAKSSSSPATPSSSTTSSASDLLSSSGHDAPAPASTPAAPAGRPPARALLKGPKGGRVTKRKTRPSRRAQTTYITADAANFRRMVQEITGLPVPGSAASSPAASEAATTAAVAPSWTPVPAPAFVLPTLDTSAFLLDRATAAPAAPEAKCSSGSASTAAAVVTAGDHDSSAMIDYFPTLESWGII